MRPSRSVPLVLPAILFLTFMAPARTPATGDSDSVRMFHAGLTMLGVRHLNVVGLGLFGVYGDWQRAGAPVNWGGEALLSHSGERRIRRAEAHNARFSSDSLYGSVSHVYEQISGIAVGGSAFRVLRPPPTDYGLIVPGISIGLAGGFILETDRVGLQSSDLDLYYGTSAPSDTDASLRPYLRPQLVISQGTIAIVTGFAILPEFVSWSAGIAYGW